MSIMEAHQPLGWNQSWPRSHLHMKAFASEYSIKRDGSGSDITGYLAPLSAINKERPFSCGGRQSLLSRHRAHLFSSVYFSPHPPGFHPSRGCQDGCLGDWLRTLLPSLHPRGRNQQQFELLWGKRIGLHGCISQSALLTIIIKVLQCCWIELLILAYLTQQFVEKNIIF